MAILNLTSIKDIFEKIVMQFELKETNSGHHYQSDLESDRKHANIGNGLLLESGTGGAEDSIQRSQSRSTAHSSVQAANLYAGRLAYKTIEEPTPEQIGGNFIYLQCGHNGYLSLNEKIVFEKHLMRSGFLTSGEDYQLRYSISGQI